jgi:hypothetical protein
MYDYGNSYIIVFIHLAEADTRTFILLTKRD